MNTEAPIELIEQLKPQGWNVFYGRLLHQILDNPKSNTMLVAGGLALSGKTAILSQLFVQLESDERLKELQGFNYVNFSFGTAMALGRKIGAIRTPIEQKGWETPEEYSEVSKLAEKTLMLALKVLPSPTLITFDAVLLSAVKYNDKLIGTDRMAGAVYQIMQAAPATAFFVTASEAQRRKSEEIRQAVLKAPPEKRSEVLLYYNIVDDSAGTPQMEGLYFNTANPVVVKRTDDDVNEVMHELIMNKTINPPSFDLKNPEQFALPERVRFMTEEYIPYWISGAEGRKCGETDFVFFNPEYSGLKHVYHSKVAPNKLTDALIRIDYPSVQNEIRQIGI